MNKVFKDFLEFIAHQPRDRSIDHDSWSSCAVGDYVRSLENCLAYNVNLATMLDVLQENDPELRELLNTASDPDAWAAQLDTYGKLGDFITGDRANDGTS
jgi:hypothetical protein